MQGYLTNIEQETTKNRNFRKVLFTAKHHQLVVMSLKPGEDIGEEVHDVDQFIRVEQGQAARGPTGADAGRPKQHGF